MFPIGDDDVHGAGLTPLITWGLILLNVLAWMLELGQGSERALQSFVEAWGVVPREYTDRNRSATRNSGARLDHSAHVDVPARRLDAPRRQHAVPLDLWGQPRKGDGPPAVSHLLSGLRRCRGGRAHHVQRQFDDPDSRGVGRDQRHPRRLPAALPSQPGAGPDAGRRGARAGARRAGVLDPAFSSSTAWAPS